MRLLCPAKINLHLRVGRRRAADGFHPLLTWMTTVGLFDTLTVEALTAPAAAADPGGRDAPAGGNRNRSAREAPASRPPHGRSDESPPGRGRAVAAGILQLSSDLPALPVDETNLVVRAADALATWTVGDSGGAGDADGADAKPTSAAGRAGLVPGGASLRQTATEDAAPSGAGVGEGVDARGAAGWWPAAAGGQPSRVGPAGAAQAGVGAAVVSDAFVSAARAVLEKRIPLGAGLGGGSSDAAGTLAALNRLWHLNWPTDRLAAIAGQLGSDVPFFLHGPSSVCTGRGEIVRPVPPPARARWAVLVLPDIHMPTPAVYRRFDELGLGFDDQIAREPGWGDWSTRPAKELLARLVNDLEGPAFELRPELGTLRAALELQLKRAVRMSGSGSSLFTLFDDDEADEATAAAAGISARLATRALAVRVAPRVTDDLNAGPSPA